MNAHPCHKFRFLIPFVVLAAIALFSAIVQALWNGVLVEVVAVKSVTYWQAMGLLVLSKILFSGFPGRRGPFGRHRAMMEACESLTPEQRDAWRAEMRRRCGFWPRAFRGEGEGTHAGEDSKGA